ncbi:M20/M25/M40 family metallo-hydrolase [Catelliglobosispora koreensis]|uniref:M20/M25/M40 family metallo-hydrolase n=1 Tax=Catelliglobosispora koreensis TaxID=129052 RepID=UPI00036B5E95|nr:M20/M25/M40 family metallo-hydrolase [Catelliglobosispora koreensis]
MLTGWNLRVVGVATSLVVIAVLLFPPQETSGSTGLLPREAVVPKLAMTDLRPHLEAFEQIAKDNGGNRAHGTPGYGASLDYVEGKLKEAGLVTGRQDFVFGNDVTANLIAELPGGDPGRVFVVGAHLDSVRTGPGINDNATGSAAILAIALAITKAGHRPPVKLRFIWWGAEEVGLRGSDHYAKTLTPEARAAITGYLNVDMIGGPNGGYFIYDGDDSKREGAGPGPAGSDRIEKALTDYYTSVNIVPFELDFGGRSDHASFLKVGIPAGGMLTGTSEWMPEFLAQQWGGQANVPFDRCYHRACDTNANVNEKVYLHHANAALHATLELSKLRA